MNEIEDSDTIEQNAERGTNEIEPTPLEKSGATVIAIGKFRFDGHDQIVVKTCPWCGEKHEHDLNPEVLLGGLAKTRAPCDIESPNLISRTYYVTLPEEGNRIPSDLIHWARQTVREENRTVSRRV